jgi:quercetin dioxygenase-like cupin family protein
MTGADEIHAPRRTPASPDAPVALSAIGQELLEQAHAMAAGRSARTLTPGAGGALKQTVLALVEGTLLEEHTAPGPATIQVLSGEVRLGTPAGPVDLHAGQWAPIPDERHDLAATSDATVLLTVASTTS